MITLVNASHIHAHLDQYAHQNRVCDYQPQPSPSLHRISTTSSLPHRLREHETIRNCTSRIIIDVGNATIHTLAHVNYNTREQLEDLEAAFIMLYRASCVNRSLVASLNTCDDVTQGPSAGRMMSCGGIRVKRVGQVKGHRAGCEGRSHGHVMV